MALLIAFVISNIGCRETEKFPADNVFEYIPKSQECYKYKIVSYDPIKVSDGVLVKPEECPLSVFGFDVDDAGPVFTWMRDMQEMVKTKCKF